MFDEKFYQMFILGSGGFEQAIPLNIGGVIFFKNDILSVNQFKNLIKSLKTCAKTPLFFSIDQEGGRVERTENIHKKFLSQQFAFEKGIEYLTNQTKEMLSELSDFGINMNFAPCLDVNSNPNNPIINERSFSNNPDNVCKGFDIVNPIYKEFNIIPVIKHFPGHGDADKDSHLELPVINLPFKEMYDVHIKPFNHAIKSGINAVMIAHLHCKCFDKEQIPTSLSNTCIKYLRNDLNYDGLIISDDMYMQGVRKSGDIDACLKGIDAGVNMFIYRNSNPDTLKLLKEVLKIVNQDKILKDKVNQSYDKIIKLKKMYQIIM